MTYPLDDLLREVEALDRAATPEPWEGTPDLGCVGYTYPGGGKFTVLVPPNPYSDVGKCDALLAARYRNAAPRLAAIVRIAVERLRAARNIIHRLPKTEEGSKSCAACGEKSSWGAWEAARSRLDPSGLACHPWCPVPAAFSELEGIDADLAHIEAIAKEVPGG